MDMSFANQALCAEWLCNNEASNCLHSVPEAIDQEVAKLKLESLKINIDVLTDEQIQYLNSWQEGT
jgi:adenosylhomocysteinase